MVLLIPSKGKVSNEIKIQQKNEITIIFIKYRLSTLDFCYEF